MLRLKIFFHKCRISLALIKLIYRHPKHCLFSTCLCSTLTRKISFANGLHQVVDGKLMEVYSFYVGAADKKVLVYNGKVINLISNTSLFKYFSPDGFF